MKVVRDFLRDLTLDCKQPIQIAVVFLGPDVRVGARVDQLRVQVKNRAGSADAAFQDMRYSQIISNLTEISFAAIFHHAGPADDFQVADLRQLGQDVILHIISKRAIFLLLAEVFKRQNGDSSCWRLPDQFTFPHDPASGRRQTNQRCHEECTCWIAPDPFPSSRENSGVSGLNWFVPDPTFEIFGQRQSGWVTTLWIFLETLEANCAKIAIYVRYLQ